MIKPESVITYVGLLALVASLPIVVQGFRRRGTGEKYQSLFWVQRAPQIAVLLNVVIIVVAVVRSLRNSAVASSAVPLLPPTNARVVIVALPINTAPAFSLALMAVLTSCGRIGV